MRPNWIRVGSNAVPGILGKEGNLDPGIHRENAVCPQRQRCERCCHKPGNGKDCQQSLEAYREHGAASPLESQEGTNPTN